jgi:hypothetical protein
VIIGGEASLDDEGEDEAAETGAGEEDADLVDGRRVV